MAPEGLIPTVAEAYLRENRPELLPVLAEYLELSEQGSELDLPEDADHFIDAKLVELVLVPLVVGVVSGYLSNLAFAYRQRRVAEKQAARADAIPPPADLLGHDEVRSAARRLTLERYSATAGEELVLEILSFTEEHLEARRAPATRRGSAENLP